MEKPENVEKNEILTSGELLEKDAYDVNLLKVFLEFVQCASVVQEQHSFYFLFQYIVDSIQRIWRELKTETRKRGEKEAWLNVIIKLNRMIHKKTQLDESSSILYNNGYSGLRKIDLNNKETKLFVFGIEKDLNHISSPHHNTSKLSSTALLRRQDLWTILTKSWFLCKVIFFLLCPIKNMLFQPLCVSIWVLQRREAFVEKPEAQPAIFRTGRRWQPPPEPP